MHALRLPGGTTFSIYMSDLTKTEIKELCDEIQLQWDYHLLSRSVFFSTFPKEDIFDSPTFYSTRGISMHVELPKVKSERFLRASKGIAVWLNQNYVIRLYGILESKSVIKIGKERNSEIIDLLRILRMNVGAHSTGKRVSKMSDLKRSTYLTNKLLGRNIEIDSRNYFTLSIDSVLLPLKNQIMDFIKSLGQPLVLKNI